MSKKSLNDLKRENRYKSLLISCFLYTCVGKGGNPWIKQFVEYLGSSSEEGDKLRDLVKRHYEGAPDLSL